VSLHVHVAASEIRSTSYPSTFIY